MKTTSSSPVVIVVVFAAVCELSAAAVNDRQPGDQYLVSADIQTGVETWGHGCTRRTLSGSATGSQLPRTWLDAELALPVGARLLRYCAYVTPVNGAAVNFTTVRFQLWAATSGASVDAVYRLLHETPATIDNIDGVVQVEVSRAESVYLPSYARIGWTTESGQLPFTFDFVDQYPLYYRTINNDLEFPVVNSSYSFNPRPYPAVFSVSVDLETRQRGATGATGSRGDTGPSGLVVWAPSPGGPAHGAQLDQTLHDLFQQTNDCRLSDVADDCDQLICGSASRQFCFCNRGYTLDDDNRTCSDVDECSRDNGGCVYNCVNKVGNYSCSCPPGLRLADNRLDCIDVDECLTVRCRMACINTFGSYSCIQLTWLQPSAAADGRGRKPRSSPIVSQLLTCASSLYRCCDDAPGDAKESRWQLTNQRAPFQHTLRWSSGCLL